jgi:hypothetical protein
VVLVAGSDGGDGTTLALALAAGLSSVGSWGVAVNRPDVGVGAARELGVALERFSVIRSPGHAFAEATAALVDGVDVTLLRAPANLPPAIARRLRTRVLDRRAVLVALSSWLDAPHLALAVTRSAWRGIGHGYGDLQERHAELTAVGRGSAAQQAGRAGRPPDHPHPHAP